VAPNRSLGAGRIVAGILFVDAVNCASLDRFVLIGANFSKTD
jgi:hypothetical protein